LQQIQLRVEQLPVQLIQRQSLFAALTKDTQHRSAFCIPHTFRS